MNEDKRTGHVIEVLCEVRFAGSPAFPAGVILPGFLYTRLLQEGMVSKFEPLPQAAIPLQMRDQDPNLRYLTTHRMTSDAGLIVAVGDHALSVSMVDAYRGWPDLEQKARAVFSKALETTALDNIERVSVKYLNLFPAVLGSDQSGLINAAFRVGSHKLTSEPFTIRTELRSNGIVAVIQISAQSTLQSSVSAQAERTGLVVDMDFIVIRPHSEIEEIMTSLQNAHELALKTYQDLTAGSGDAK